MSIAWTLLSCLIVQKLFSVYYRLLLIVTIGLCLQSEHLLAFTPENTKQFLSNSFNLLSNRQYSFLGDYFTNHYASMLKHDARFPRTAETQLVQLIKKIPLVPVRTQLLTIILNDWDKRFPQKRSRYHCLSGELALTHAAYAAAAAAYQQCRSPLRVFYLALIEKSRGNFPASKQMFQQALKQITQARVRDEIYLSLAFMAHSETRYAAAITAAQQSRASLQKDIALYKSYRASDNAAQTATYAKKLRRRAQTNAAARAFIAELATNKAKQ